MLEARVHISVLQVLVHFAECRGSSRVWRYQQDNGAVYYPFHSDCVLIGGEMASEETSACAMQLGVHRTIGNDIQALGTVGVNQNWSTYKLADAVETNAVGSSGK